MDDEVEDFAAVRAARALAADLLAPAAAAVDVTAVPRSHLTALGEAGLLGIAAPDAGVPGPVLRRVQEVLAGADLATWFVSVQHHSPVRLVAAGPPSLRRRLLADLLTGRLLGGVSFAHLRRGAQCPVRAARVRGGWRLDGTAPRCTGWGINDVIALGAATADGDVLFLLVPAEAGPGLRAGEPHRLAAMSATRTVSLELDGLVVEDEDVMLRQPFPEWARDDRRTTVNLLPAVLGVTAAAIAGLRRTAEQRDIAVGPALAESLDARLAAVRTEVARLMDGVDPDQAHGERLAARAVGQRLALDATAAYVTACGGAGMALSHEAQRLARGALFLVVQAQTPSARDALLSVLLAARP